ncbi:MAG TPA: thioredoxin domain-containing protein [Actinomycetota bacterium]
MAQIDPGARLPNRLIHEMSPYLIQHAYNPVDWYPWGPEALERARAEDKPILLSIGYAACHWCHVMERESFEDDTVAAYMNEHFVCIKVDREERPDLDSIYMDAVQAMTGQGGWPMTMFLTPDTVPFHGGTYFPPTDRAGMPGFLRVLRGVAGIWEEKREEVRVQSAAVLERLQAFANAASPSDDPLDAGLIDHAVTELGRTFDRLHGGFGASPKFPQPPVLELLLRVAASGSDPERELARDMVEFTLRRMAHQGIYDQVGGGFHRYATDRAWLVPHFEKMLYDNAQLARLYTHAYQAWNLPLYRRIAVETLEYLLRDMRDPAGGFHSSEDADSEGQEGKFYVWDYAEFTAVAPEAAGWFGVSERGNWEGTNILIAASDDPPDQARARLLEARSKRVRPGLDNKVLTSWNGLAIAALAEAGAAFARPDLVDAARAAAGFVLDTMRDANGRLLHAYKEGRASVQGMLEDYAYLADGLFALWEATFEPRWIEAAQELAGQMVDLFWDEEGGGFFSTGIDHEALLVRQKELVESVTPSPNGVAALALQKMAIITGDGTQADRARQVLRLARTLMDRAPQAAPSFLAALDFHLGRPKEVVIVSPGDAPGDETAALLRTVWDRFLPNRVLAGAPPGIPSPLLEGKLPKGGVPTAFVCEGYACRAPTTDPGELGRLLDA